MSHKSEFKVITKHVVGPAGHITLKCETVWVTLLCSALKQARYLLALWVLRALSLTFGGGGLSLSKFCFVLWAQHRPELRGCLDGIQHCISLP